MINSTKGKVGIIGAGVMGLTLGYRLAREGYQIKIFEANEQVGGLSGWFDYGTFVWDKYYHAILKSDTDLLDLLGELNLSHHMRWTPTSTGFLWKGQLFSMSNYKEFLTFPPLNLIDKFRLGLGILYGHYLQSPDKLVGVTAKKWLIDVFGKSIYEAVWDPLLESKYGVLKEKIPSKIIWGVINRYFSTRNKKDGKEWMGYLSGGGLRILIGGLADEIERNGGAIFCREKVLKVCRETDGGIAVFTDCGEYHFDRLISTLPTKFTFSLIPELNTRTEPLPDNQEFLGVIRLALILKESLSPYYVTNLIDKNLPYTGIIELSRLADPVEFGGKTLVMLPRYDLSTSEWFQRSDEEITSVFLDKIRLTWPSIDDNLCGTFVHREKIVQSIRFDDDYPREPLRSGDSKIWCINSELIGGESLNNNAIIKVANKTVKKFMMNTN